MSAFNKKKQNLKHLHQVHNGSQLFHCEVTLNLGNTRVFSIGNKAMLEMTGGFFMIILTLRKCGYVKL